MGCIENVDVSQIKAKVYNLNTYPFEKFYQKQLVKHQKGETRSQKRTDIVDSIITFDIETTALDDIKQSVCYIWQCCIDGDIIIGRTINSVKVLFDKLSMYLDRKTKVVVYVHNLSYEFEFLHEILNFTDVFAISKRHPLVARYKHIEFRCSYLLTNMRLSKFLEEMHVDDQKTTLDYSIKRYPWTYIMDKEAIYCINDVLGLYQAIKEKLRREHDTLITIPLTSTGYTRRDVREVMKHTRGTKKFREAIPDFHLHMLLYEAFRGGNTHANRWISGKLIENVIIHSKDIASSYPNVLTKYKYPWKFEKINIPDTKFYNYCLSKDKAILTRITITNVRLADKSFGCPYIPISKCSERINSLEDNGRVLSADKISMMVTDIDMSIINRIYKYDTIEYSDSYIANKDYLPKPLIELIVEYFKNKTSLKNIDEEMYLKFKNRFNAVYGLSVQNGAKGLLCYDPEVEDLFKWSDQPLEEIYEQNSSKFFLLYQWGVWVTAYARKCLDDGLQLIEKQGGMFLYCDTDSLKYIGDIDFSEYNQKQTELSQKIGAIAKTSKGDIKILGIYEDEKDMNKFITHGAKKYGYTIPIKKRLDDNYTLKYNERHLTISGVSKKLGSKEIRDLKNFHDGFIFREAAGNDLVYNDHPTKREVVIDNHLLHIYSNIYMHSSTYTVTKSDKYRKLLDDLNYTLTIPD